MTGPALLEARNISKSFGDVRACEDVSLSLREGEIVALLGENGAGKSTLVKLVFGALQPDEGVFLWRGKPVVLEKPADARRLGIGMVHQHFSLFEAFSAVQNIALALPDQPMAGLAERTREVSAAYGLALDPGALVADLSAGERQRIEIVRCLLQDPTLIIMDEPTSVLTPQEADTLFATLRRLREEGRTILYISHKLEEVRALCERAIVMRAGHIVGALDPRATSAADMAEAMVGTAIADLTPRPAPAASAVPHLLVKGLSHGSDRLFGTSLKDIDLAVASGEVLGIAGMAGNGQSELFGCLSGELLSDRQAIAIKGRPVGDLGVDARRRLGGAFVPEERLGHSAVPDFDLVENTILSRHNRRDNTVSAGFLRRGAARRSLSRVIAAMDVRAPSGRPFARMLSGGNLQKFVMGRELDGAPDVLVVNQPTWGVDAGAAVLIRQALIDLAASGAAVLLISQDLDELFQTAHRIAVISAGRLSAPQPASALTRTEIGLLMGAGEREPTLAH